MRRQVPRLPSGTLVSACPMSTPRPCSTRATPGKPDRSSSSMNVPSLRWRGFVGPSFGQDLCCGSASMRPPSTMR
ncbi:hypothetical protein BDV38DRAFT_249602 [Aspergillus pseudotamarii]|uniref:Uncharacterized protein n=1 Tax=Aspergillus pseudotamarii TaxID=132259 RepID=A0A5N6STM6_ASPPS|nr:uncharacterized protein BDV38DRAFT_249602 [Aspergillus pseudotamarii]KAE8136484.1 hypothetical protein BDV38DRAFT_249602 [Aspergillus pseudotamarii]